MAVAQVAHFEALGLRLLPSCSAMINVLLMMFLLYQSAVFQFSDQFRRTLDHNAFAACFWWRVV